MKYYEYISTAHTAYPPQFHAFYPPAAVSCTIPPHIPPQPKAAEAYPSQTKAAKEAVCPEKKGKICDPKF